MIIKITFISVCACVPGVCVCVVYVKSKIKFWGILVSFYCITCKRKKMIPPDMDQKTCPSHLTQLEKSLCNMVIGNLKTV